VPKRPSLRATTILAGFLVAGALAVVAIRKFLDFRPVAITIGPETTWYFTDDPPLRIRVHEAIHRRQMRDQSPLGRVWNAVRYNFDYGYRLDEEAEAKAGELCLRIHRFNTELPDYTTARSLSQAQAYRAWAWERLGESVADRVGAKLQGGAACHAILRSVELDLPPGARLDDDEVVELAAFRFLKAYGSSDREVRAWRARLDLAGHTVPASWDLPDELPHFELIEVGRSVAAPADTALTPSAAGQALHRLTYYMAERMYVQLQPPPRGYRGQALLEPGEAEARVGVPVVDWPRELLDRAAEGRLSEEQVAWLDTLSLHPLHTDFDTFALAPGADILGTRYRLPFPDRWERLALSELDPIVTAFHAQWGRAALAAARGDTAVAESVLRTVVAAALQWIENAPFEVDVVEGLTLLDRALDDLRSLEERRGEPGEWVERYVSAGPEDWLRGTRFALFATDVRTMYQAMPALAADPGIPHAFKRSAYRQVVLADVCLEMRSEPDVRQAHDRWRTVVELYLVRRPSDRDVLELQRRTVRALVKTAEVPPDQICSAEGGLRPNARMSIMAWRPAADTSRVTESDD
jgi:hypothetical protein